MKVDVTDQNRESCSCPGCPTYEQCMREGSEILYCGVGRTTCAPESKGCVCGACAVLSHYELTGRYFCFSGEAR